MGYPKDLEEYTDLHLRKELKRRQMLRHEGKCSYCEQPLDGRSSGFKYSNPCRYHETVVVNTNNHIYVTRRDEQCTTQL